MQTMTPRRTDSHLALAERVRSYIDAQKAVNQTYLDPVRWNRMSILNCANSGWFSSDRTIGQYADEIWKTGPVG